MAERGREVQTQLVTIFQRLTVGQKVLFGVMSVGVILGTVLLISVVNTPGYAPLFNNLSAEDASKIVEKLQSKDVPYKLEDAGKTILVPRPNVYDLRLSLAGEGLPHSGSIGYEIFDRTNLGISDFVQKVNYRRAMEGELARTILTLEEVEAARVHLVLPERTLFKEDEKHATASVVLKLKSSAPLKRETVQGITHLVASSVEGLDATDVTIVDSKGVLLSDQPRPNLAAVLTSSQLELQQKVEGYLSQKAQRLLESVVGLGNALVQVNADLDFRQVERTMEQYDPENTAVRSEQISEETSSAGDSANSGGRSSTVTNYEVNKSVEHIVEGMGAIKRLSVAALVNGVPTSVTRDGQTVTEIVPRSPQEMNSLTELVKKAVGFTDVRKDEVTVTNLSFGTNVSEQDFVYKQEPTSDWTKYIDTILLAVSMLAAVIILWSLLRRFRRGIELSTVETVYPWPATAVGGKRMPPELSMPEEEMSPEVMYRGERRRHVNDYVREKPSESARLLKVWLSED